MRKIEDYKLKIENFPHPPGRLTANSRFQIPDWLATVLILATMNLPDERTKSATLRRQRDTAVAKRIAARAAGQPNRRPLAGPSRLGRVATWKAIRNSQSTTILGGWGQSAICNLQSVTAKKNAHKLSIPNFQSSISECP
jgi:hypothetical protein